MNRVPAARLGFTLVEVLIAIGLGMYLCMLSGVILIGVHKVTRAIDRMGALQESVRSLCERGSLQSLTGDAINAQAIAFQLPAMATAPSAKFAMTYAYPPGTSASWGISLVDVYGAMDARPVAQMGAASVAGGALGAYAGKTVRQLTLDQSIQIYTGRRMVAVDQVRNLASLQTISPVAGVYQNQQVYVVDDAGQTDPFNLLSRTTATDLPAVYLGDRLHLLIPVL